MTFINMADKLSFVIFLPVYSAFGAQWIQSLHWLNKMCYFSTSVQRNCSSLHPVILQWLIG
jgi:hypothetical protein